MERPNAWKTYKKTELKNVEKLSDAYKAFLDAGKTERECAAFAIRELEKAGYIPLEKAMAEGRKLKAGERIAIRDGDLQTGGSAIAIRCIRRNQHSARRQETNQSGLINSGNGFVTAAPYE